MYYPQLTIQEDQICPGKFLISNSNLYMVESFLGCGAFGKVAKCMRVNDKKTVAIKMIKKFHHAEAFREVNNKNWPLVKDCFLAQ